MTWGHLNWAIYCGASGSGMGTPIWKKSLPCALPCLESFLDPAGSNFGSAALICLDPFLDLSGSIFGSGSIFRSVWIPFWIWLDPSLDLDQIMDLAGSIFGSGWIHFWIWLDQIMDLKIRIQFWIRDQGFPNWDALTLFCSAHCHCARSRFY